FNTSNNSASDLTHITAPVLAITKTHAPEPFTVGQTGTYTINVSNTGPVATVGAVNVSDFLPSGLTATAVSGAGWTCSAFPRTSPNFSRSSPLARASAYPFLLVTVSVGNSNPTIPNFANVNGGAESQSHSCSDSANVNTPTLTLTNSHTGDFNVRQIGFY